MSEVCILFTLGNENASSYKIITFEVKVDEKKVTVVNPVLQVYIKLLYDPLTGY